jgi:branched-chain amino acid transport system substrate-binding protein
VPKFITKNTEEEEKIQMKKTVTLLSILLVLSLVLAACGAEPTPEPTATVEQAAPTQEPTEAAPEPTAPPEAGCTDDWGCVELEAGDTVKIAYVGPMTGDYSAFGIDISRGAELAVVDNPEIKGFEVELVIEDTQGSPEQGAAVANKLAADPQVVAVAGHTFSGSTEAAIPVYEDAGIVMVSPSTTLVGLPLVGPNVYNRVAFSDGDQGRMAAEFIYNELGIQKVVGVHDGGAYGKGLVEVMTENFEGLGGEVLGIEAITPGETDYSAQLADIATLDPELVYYGGYDADAAVLVSQMAGAGLGDAIFFGCDGTYGVNYIELSGSASEGTYSTYVPIPPSDRFERFKTDYEAAYGDPQGKLSPFSPHGYDSVSVILSAIDEVSIESDGKLTIPRHALALAVRSLKDFQGLTGPLTNDGTGNLAAAEPVFMIVENGEWVQASGMEDAGPYVCDDDWGCVELEAGDSVKIAYVGPMTGDYSAFGIDISRGAELAVVADPDVKGWKVELSVEDTQGSPEQGAAVANKLAADPQVVAVAGHTFSGSTEAAIPVYEDAGIVMVSPSTTLVGLPLVGPNVYNRVAFSDGDQGRMAAEYIYNTLGIRQVVAVHDGGAYGKGLVEVMAENFEGLGGEVLGIEAITPGETDYSAQLADIATLDPELVYYGGYDADAAVLVSQMAGAGLGNALFFGCDGTYGVNYIELSGSASEGTYSTYVPIPPSDAFEQFRVDYEAAYGDPQGKLSPFSPHGYDSVSVILSAIWDVSVESGGKLYIPRHALALAVRSLKDFQGLTGPLTNDGTGNLAAAAPLFMVVENGEWVEAPGQ